MIFTKSTALENQKSDTPKLSLQYEQIGIDTHTIRSLDWDRSRFDIEFGLRNGTTYNSFLIRGKKTALIDTSHLKFKDIWFEKLRQEINPTEIDYLIVSHTEPDHSGLIKYSKKNHSRSLPIANKYYLREAVSHLQSSVS